MPDTQDNNMERTGSMATRKKCQNRHTGIMFVVGTVWGFMVSTALLITTRHVIQLTVNSYVRSRGNAQADSSLNLRQTIYAAVVTSQNSLPRAEAVQNTWGRGVSKLEFFVRQAGIKDKSLSLIQLPASGIDHGELPDKFSKHDSFDVARHACDKYVHQFDWFLLGTDDIYLNLKSTKELLQSLDKDKQLYLSRLSSDEKQSRKTCTEDSGIIISGALLRNVCKHIGSCMRDIKTEGTEGDDKNGKADSLIDCIQLYTDKACTRWPEPIEYFVHVEDDVGQENLAFGDFNDVKKRYGRSVTVHPVPQPWIMYKLHSHFLMEQMTVRSKKLDAYARNEAAVKSYVPRWSVTAGDVKSQQIDSAESEQKWTTFLSQSVLPGTGCQVTKPIVGHLKRRLQQVVTYVEDIVQASNGFDFTGPSSLVAGYYTEELHRSNKHIVHIANTKEGDAKIQSLSRTFLTQQIEPPKVTSVDTYRISEKLWILLPLRLHDEHFARFFQTWQDIDLTDGIKLLTILFIDGGAQPNSKSSRKGDKYITSAKDILDIYQKALNSRSKETIKVVRLSGSFERSRGVEAGVKYLKTVEKYVGAIMLAHTNLQFEKHVLNRCKVLAQKGKVLHLMPFSNRTLSEQSENQYILDKGRRPFIQTWNTDPVITCDHINNFEQDQKTGIFSRVHNTTTLSAKGPFAEFLKA